MEVLQKERKKNWPLLDLLGPPQVKKLLHLSKSDSSFAPDPQNVAEAAGDCGAVPPSDFGYKERAID